MIRGSLRARAGGSRYLYEPFDSAHARIEALERVLDERWAALERSLSQIDESVERLEKRLWFAVFGLATAMLGQLATALMPAPIHP
ncbi:MAG: GTA head formation protein, RCAP_rcc01685 family [Pseudomonadota bacterium]